ncbi:hypothetical protein HYALB_00001599 [Hymenoscyphus albidus]|uniref:Uncharacterized protein n=1 Tax=Hymenoscyphus albidus TaxID=595503 RepID=A0A9N9LDR2_9HELO|nr:hypothetical protein HYALB_00001599 [Hymenoscyphus albidus]
MGDKQTSVPYWLGQKGYENRTERWLAENENVKAVDLDQNHVNDGGNSTNEAQKEEPLTAAAAGTINNYEVMFPMSYESEDEEKGAGYQAAREPCFFSFEEIHERARHQYDHDNQIDPVAALYFSTRTKVEKYNREKVALGYKYPSDIFYQYYVENYADDDEKLDKAGLRQVVREMRGKQIQKKLVECELVLTREALCGALQLFYDDRKGDLYDGIMLAALNKLRSFGRGKFREMTDNDEPVVDGHVYGHNGFADLVAWEADCVCWRYHLNDTAFGEELLEFIRTQIDGIRGFSLDEGPQVQPDDKDGAAEMETNSSAVESSALTKEKTDEETTDEAPTDATSTSQTQEEDDIDTSFTANEHLTGDTFTGDSPHTASYASIQTAFSHGESNKKPPSKESVAEDDENASVASGLESLMEDSDEELNRDYAAENSLKSFFKMPEHLDQADNWPLSTHNEEPQVILSTDNEGTLTQEIANSNPNTQTSIDTQTVNSSNTGTNRNQPPDNPAITEISGNEDESNHDITSHSQLDHQWILTPPTNLFPQAPPPISISVTEITSPQGSTEDPFLLVPRADSPTLGFQEHSFLDGTQRPTNATDSEPPSISQRRTRDRSPSLNSETRADSVEYIGAQGLDRVSSANRVSRTPRRREEVFADRDDDEDGTIEELVSSLESTMRWLAVRAERRASAQREIAMRMNSTVVLRPESARLRRVGNSLMVNETQDDGIEEGEILGRNSEEDNNETKDEPEKAETEEEYNFTPQRRERLMELMRRDINQYDARREEEFGQEHGYQLYPLHTEEQPIPENQTPDPVFNSLGPSEASTRTIQRLRRLVRFRINLEFVPEDTTELLETGFFSFLPALSTERPSFEERFEFRELVLSLPHDTLRRIMVMAEQDGFDSREGAHFIGNWNRYLLHFHAPYPDIERMIPLLHIQFFIALRQGWGHWSPSEHFLTAVRAFMEGGPKGRCDELD